MATVDLMKNWNKDWGGNITSGAAQASSDITGVKLPDPINAVKSTVSGILGGASSAVSNAINKVSKNSIDKKKQFAKGEVTNKYGNYSKSNAAKQLGISKEELSKRAKAAGYGDTESYYKALTSGKIKAPTKTSPVAKVVTNVSNGILGSIPTEKVYAEDSKSTQDVNQGVKSYGLGNWGTPEMGVTENPLQAIGNVVSRVNPLTSILYDAFLKNKLRGVGGGNTSSLATAPTNLANVESYLTNLSTPSMSNYGSVTPTKTSSTIGATSAGTGTLSDLSGLFSTSEATGEVADPYKDIIETQGDLTEDQIDEIKREYEQLAASANNQLAYLQNQYGTSSQNFENQASDLLNKIALAKENAKTANEANIQSAYESANTTQRANRNVLRALGILGSSAAGDILSRPLVAADKEAASQRSALTSRLAELDNSEIQNTKEIATKRAELENQYQYLIANIQNDIRFNEEEKIDAIQQARDAFSARQAELEQASLAWTNSIEQQKQAYALQLAQILAYTNPGNVSGILSSAFKV